MLVIKFRFDSWILVQTILMVCALSIWSVICCIFFLLLQNKALSAFLLSSPVFLELLVLKIKKLRFLFLLFRMLTCPATEMVDGSKVLYFEQVCVIFLCIFRICNLSFGLGNWEWLYSYDCRHFGELLKSPFDKYGNFEAVLQFPVIISLRFGSKYLSITVKVCFGVQFC